jgi:hypothetical protein
MTRPANDFEQRLTTALHREASLAMTATDTSHELDRWRDQQNKRKNRMRVTVAVIGAAAAVAVILGLTLGLVGSDDAKPEPAQTPPAPTPSAPATVSLATLDPIPAGTEVTTTKGPINPGAVAFGALWATGIDATEDEVYRLDQDTGALLSTTHVTPAIVSNPVAVRVGDHVLVTGRSGGKQGYVALDQSGKADGFIPAQQPGVMAGTADGGWVQLAATTIGQVDATGTKILRRVRVADPDTGALFRGIAVVGDSVYVTTQLPKTVYRIDANSGAVVDTIELDTVPAGLTATSTGVYVATESYELLRIDPGLDAITAVLTNDLGVNSFFIPFVGPKDSLWVTPNHGGLVELDPTTLEPLRSFMFLSNPEPGWDFGGAVADHRGFVGDARGDRVLSVPLD